MTNIAWLFYFADALESDVGKDVMEIIKFKIKSIKKELVKNED